MLPSGLLVRKSLHSGNMNYSQACVSSGNCSGFRFLEALYQPHRVSLCSWIDKNPFKDLSGPLCRSLELSLRIAHSFVTRCSTSYNLGHGSGADGTWVHQDAIIFWLPTELSLDMSREGTVLERGVS